MTSSMEATLRLSTSAAADSAALTSGGTRALTTSVFVTATAELLCEKR
jgi:hypothetical protein